MEMSRLFCRCGGIRMKYKIVYYAGESIDIHTKVKNAVLTEVDGVVTITERRRGGETLPLSGLASVELFRLHGLGRMLKIRCGGRTVYLTVVRFCIGSLFAVVNFLATGRLYHELQGRCVPRAGGIL